MQMLICVLATGPGGSDSVSGRCSGVGVSVGGGSGSVLLVAVLMVVVVKVASGDGNDTFGDSGGSDTFSGCGSRCV